jgi:endonuclease G, mitochondrial
MPYLTAPEIQELVIAARDTGLATPASRNNLLSALNVDYVQAAIFDIGGTNVQQLMSDLTTINLVDQLADGSVPLRDWLRQADFLARLALRREADVFTRYAARVDAKASGQPAMPAANTLREVINNEDIIHRDDMVDIWFLSAGARAGESVAKLYVPKFQGRDPLIQGGRHARMLGTGWLITPRHLVTNYHVIAARRQDEPPVGQDDFLLQGAKTTAKFDYNSVDDDGSDVEAEAVEASDAGLDFAIIRLKSDVTTRRPLQIQETPMVFEAGAYLPLNIIQHPSGNPKRVALRNNLLTSADAVTIRYFTDTLGGSSGSPVFDDTWRVVGLHRGAQSVQGVSFQGRDTAVVNVGTQVSAILSYLAAHHPDLRQQIQV